MRRILLVLTVALIMAAMMVASALPVLAAPKDAQGCENNKTSVLDTYCSDDDSREPGS